MLRSFTTLPIMFLHQQADVQSWVDKAVEANIKYWWSTSLSTWLTATGKGLPWPSTWPSLRPDWPRWSRASLWSPLATTRPVAPRAWPSSHWPGLGGRPLPFILTLFGREFLATQEMTRPCWPRLGEPYTTTHLFSNHYAVTTSCLCCPHSPWHARQELLGSWRAGQHRPRWRSSGHMSHLPSTSAK